ncbi:hypothetical protein EDB89DRAFT_209371 [Lactarius sanguifluus]|nr:hypothetical protein EDB89DRAFT_209371 [Lactarius sanguifluus]
MKGLFQSLWYLKVTCVAGLRRSEERARAESLRERTGWHLLTPFLRAATCPRQRVSGRFSHPPVAISPRTQNPRFFRSRSTSCFRPVSTSLPRTYLPNHLLTCTCSTFPMSFECPPSVINATRFLSCPISPLTRPHYLRHAFFDRRHTGILPRKAKVSDSQRTKNRRPTNAIGNSTVFVLSLHGTTFSHPISRRSHPAISAWSFRAGQALILYCRGRAVFPHTLCHFPRYWRSDR